MNGVNDPEIAKFRENHLGRNLATSYKSDICQKLIQNFRAKNLTLQKEDAPYRVLSHWDSLGLLECDRENGNGWRRFNIIERLWVQVIIEMRKLGLSLEKILVSKPFFFKKISDDSWLTYAEYYSLSAYAFKRPTYLIVLEDGRLEFLDWHEFKNLNNTTHLGHFITLSLGKLFSEILKKPLDVCFPREKQLSNHLLEISNLIDFEDFDFLKIIKEKNKLKSYEYQKSFSGNTCEKELTEGYENYEIKKKVVEGKITSRTRTVKKKL